MGGALRHLSGFLPELGRIDGSNEYIVFIRESLPFSSSYGNIKFITMKDKAAGSWFSRVGNDVFILPGKLKKEGYSCLVSMTNFGPIWSSVPHVFFQTNAIYYWPYYLKRVNGRLKIENILRRKLALASMMRAELIVTPSQAMADMIRDMCPETASRPFKVLYHGFSRDSLQDSLDTKFDNLFSNREGFRLLYPTHPAPHKGFDVLFDALAELRNKGVEFTFYTTVSRDDWPDEVRRYERQVADLDLKDRVVFLGRVTQGQMGSLYPRCDLMIYPSLCESFGFSMIEAMGYGLPIVAADTAVNREICGGGAIYYPPLDPKSAAAAICEALKPDVNRKLLEAGKNRVDGFDWSWRRYSREFVDMIENVT
ncbi:MAG: glycosyltransferase family 1 protein [Myxococcales bacterium]|nr:MAG: glycosyltransferase family 1 protein [Myxococcales bacterium]